MGKKEAAALASQPAQSSSPSSQIQPTLPRLQAVNSGSSPLADQINQAAHIIGFPSHWESLRGDARAPALDHVVPAPDWVFKWILEKMKDANARATPSAWTLLDWMIEVLPISHCASHLRDTQFVTVLEQTLQENFGIDALAEPITASSKDSSRDSGDSALEDAQTSGRKRKRGASAAGSPSKRAALGSNALAQLFHAVMAVVKSIIQKSQMSRAREGLAPAELMKMVFKTESAQAARVLKSGLVAVNRLYTQESSAKTAADFDLAPLVEMWALRTMEADDQSGTSSDEYTTECLIPTLVLLQTFQKTPELSEAGAKSSPLLKDNINTLDRLLVRHVLAPARAAFVDGSGSEKQETNLLSTYLAPLRAILLQAAQMQDSGEPVPHSLLSLFAVVPHLLSLTIRSSPARSLKSKVSERPWIQAAFVALAECAGCTFEAPRFETPVASIDAVKDCLRVLASRDFNIDADVLKNLFWFHSGFEFPAGQDRSIHWVLVEALAELDADIFIEDPRSTWHAADDKPDNLTLYLFEKISQTKFGHNEAKDPDEMDVDQDEGAKLSLRKTSQYATADVVDKIVVPLLDAYTRNRDLLGFMNSWDAQLSHAKLADHSIWESPKLAKAFATHFEHSLTSKQISSLFQQHTERLGSTKKSKKGRSAQLFSSVVLVKAMLQSLSSDGIIESLKPHLLSVWGTLSLWIHKEIPSSIIQPGLVWSTLCQLLMLLWPIHLHASVPLQEDQLYPLIKASSKAVALPRKSGDGSRNVSDSRASAMAFMLTACDCLQSLPDTKELIVKNLRRALKSLDANDLDSQELASILEIFCAEHVLLLENFEQDASKDMFVLTLTEASQVEHSVAQHIVASLSESVFTHGTQPLQTSCTAAILSIMSRDDQQLRPLLLTSLLYIVPSSISRDQRESILNAILGMLASATRAEDANIMLSIMVNFMGVANATAEISSDGNRLSELVQLLHKKDMETPLVLQLLQSLTHMTLTHILPNRDQSQNKDFLRDYCAQIISAVQKKQKSFPARLALLQGSYSATIKGVDIFPIDEYVFFLTSLLEKEKLTVQVLESLKNIPAHSLSSDTETFTAAQTFLRSWAPSRAHLDSNKPMESATFTSQSPQFWINLHGVLGRFQLFKSHENLAQFTFNLLAQDLPYQQKTLILKSFKDSMSPLSTSEKLGLLSVCVPDDDDTAPVAYRLQHALISSMEDRQEADTDLQQQQMAIFPRLCLLLERSPSDAAFNAVLDSIDTILRDKPSFTTQQSIECLLDALSRLTSRSSPRLSTSHAPAIYTRICETARLMLVLHRSRLGGRFPLLLPLLQGLLLCLFIPNTGRGAALPPWLDPFSTLSSSTRLTPANAASFTRLLSTLCSPTQSAVARHSAKSKSNSNKDLNDPIKAARDYTAQFAYPLLSSYCRFQLYGRLDAEVRAELLPGVRELVGVASLERDAVDAMFAGLGRSERDVWRSVWKDYEVDSGRERRKVVDDGEA